MTAAEQDILTWFEDRDMGLELVRHQATATVADGEAVRAGLPGGHSKSLLVQDKSGSIFLIVALGSHRADLKRLAPAIGAEGRLSFASEDVMLRTLGVRPGSVTPMALVNDRTRAIKGVAIDRALTEFATIWCHPLHNEASIGISPNALKAFVKAHGPSPFVIDIIAPPVS